MRALHFSRDAVLAHLRAGDFTLLAPVFAPSGPDEPAIVKLHRDGGFAGQPAELAEALTCGAFLGSIQAVEYLLAVGVPPRGGDATGLDAVHWAANRGQIATLQLLLSAGAPIETRNSYGGTVLGAAVWAAVHEAKPGHLSVIEALLQAGADVREAEFPSGSAPVDALLASFGARAAST